MSRTSTFLQLTANALKDAAIKDGIDGQIHNQDIAALASIPSSTFSSWLTAKDGNGNQQLASVLAMLDYLDPDKVTEILKFVLRKQSIKRAIEENRRPQKAKRKILNKKAPALLRFSGQ